MTASLDCDDGTPHAGPRLECREVKDIYFDELESIRSAFQPFASCVLQQSWQGEPSRAFAPGSVRVAWSGFELLVYAELVDVDIFSGASAPNQRLWELGDAFEIFLGLNGKEAYVELQVAPNNQRLQLRYESHAALDFARTHGDLKSVLIAGEAFRSNVWVEDDCWCVVAGIPAALVCGSQTTLPGSCWRYSFSRYDYTRGHQEPVISSTSPHAKPDFHRKQEWGYLHFKAS